MFQGMGHALHHPPSRAHTHTHLALVLFSFTYSYCCDPDIVEKQRKREYTQKRIVSRTKKRK